MAGNRPHSYYTDEELLAAFRKTGDNSWLGALLQRYTTLLLGVAMKYLQDRALAEDAVQAIFLKTLTHLPEDEINNFKGWLYVLTRNYCLQQLRDQKRQVPVGEWHADRVADETTNNAPITEAALPHLNDALQALSTEQQQAITLFYLERQSYEQIILKTGFSFMQVKSYIQNGKRNLKSILLKKTGQNGNER